MVEIKLVRDSVKVVIKGASRPWDFEEYLIEDLRLPNRKVGDSMTLHGITLEETTEGLLVDPGDHFLFVRPTKKLRLAWSGSVLLTYDEFGQADFVLVGTSQEPNIAA